MQDMGVTFKLNTCIDDASALIEGSSSHGTFDNVFVSPGLQDSRSPSWESEKCMSALVYLEHANGTVKPIDNANVAYQLSHGHSIVIVGGGSVALDCAITAKRMGATSVHVLAVESLLNYPAEADEVTVAQNLGIQLHGQIRISNLDLLDSRNAIEVEMDAGDGNVTNGMIGASLVVYAIGQQPNAVGTELLEQVQQSQQTKKMNDGGYLYSGGDITSYGHNQCQTVVGAVRDGKQAASDMLPNIPLAPRPQVSLQTSFCGITYENPFTLSSSPVTNTAEMIGRSYDAGILLTLRAYCGISWLSLLR